MRAGCDTYAFVYCLPIDGHKTYAFAYCIDDFIFDFLKTGHDCEQHRWKL